MKMSFSARLAIALVFPLALVRLAAGAEPATLEDAVATEQAAGGAPATSDAPAAVTGVNPEEIKGKYLRLQRDRRGRPTSMDIAIVRYEPVEKAHRGTVVDLIGAVHVADAGYFERLNREFENYEAVLYELVATEGTRPEQGRRPSGGNPISSLQTGLTRVLDLQYQLDGIDYQADNMVHADMSPEEFAQSMRDRGESVLSMFVRMVGYAMMQQSDGSGRSSDMEILMALLNKNRSLALKRAVAKQFEDLGGAMMAIDGPDGSTLISERNKKALAVLEQELKEGKKKIGVFYGAGHMPDMAKRLEDDFNMKATGTRWLTAWEMSDPR